MKITEIKAFPLKAARDIFLVKIETDEGIYGLGEGGCSSRELAEAEAVKHFSRFLVGMDPMRIEHIWQKCYRSNYHEGGRVLTGAISAIGDLENFVRADGFRVSGGRMTIGSWNDRTTRIGPRRHRNRFV